MVKDYSFEWTDKSRRELDSLIRDTAEFGEDALKVCVIVGYNFSNFAQKHTPKGKTNVYRKFVDKSGGYEYWLAPTDSRQRNFEIIAANLIGKGPKNKSAARFTPRGLGWHKKTWAANANKLVGISRKRQNKRRKGESISRVPGGARWAAKRGSVEDQIAKFWRVITVRHYGPAIEAMDKGGRGLKARGIMGYALKKAKGKQKQFLWIKKRELEGMWR